MKLSFSNIAWTEEDDVTVYRCLRENGYHAIEIAPTRWFMPEPYLHTRQAQEKAQALWETWGLQISSMQSIWYGRSERMFGTDAERRILLDYTKRAIDFAREIGCKNLVFGCPRNRARTGSATEEQAAAFFRNCAQYAQAAGVCIALEANPPIYYTDYINETAQAFDCVRIVDRRSFQVNLDLGTMLYYHERPELIKGHVCQIHHVHISEPGLAVPCHEEFTQEILSVLLGENFSGYVSVEMGRSCGLKVVLDTAERFATLSRRQSIT